MKTTRAFKGMGSYGTIGIEIVLSILLGLFVGIKLDEWLHTAPWMSVLWFGFGCAAAGRSVYRSWKSMQAAAKREEAEEGNPAQAFPDDKTLAWKRQEEKEAREALESQRKAAAGADGEAAAGADGDGGEKPLENHGESATTENDKAVHRND